MEAPGNSVVIARQSDTKDYQSLSIQPSKRLGKSKEGQMLSLMEMFTELKLAHVLFKPMSFLKFRNLEALKEKCMKEFANVTASHETLHEMHKDVLHAKATRPASAQQLHNTKTNVSPVNTIVGDYVMVHTLAGKEHKPQAKWRGPMRVKKAGSSLVHIVENL